MLRKFKRLVGITALGALSIFGTSERTMAQTYQIDCAILLCLSGGWPASGPCMRARGEFIRRITPWPVEPPLQIWRCPMGASYTHENHAIGRIYDVLFPDVPRSSPLSFRAAWFPDVNIHVPMRHSRNVSGFRRLPGSAAPRLVQDHADIDISGPEFNFVRSIRVYDIRFASQRLAGEKNDCMRFASVYLGTYGMQGEFTWRFSSPVAVPEAHIGLEGWGQDCRTIFNRSVFVDWQDFEGNYGFEQVNY